MSKAEKIIHNVLDKVKVDANRKVRFPLLRRTVVFLIMPLVLLAVLELMHLTNGNAVLLFFSSPYFPVKLLISYAFILSVQWFLWCITQHTFTAVCINTALFYVLGFATEVMISLTGDPLLPTDILLIGALDTITSFVRIPFVPFAVAASVVAVFSCIAYFVWHRRAQRPKMKLWMRLCCMALGVAFFAINIYYVCVDYDFRRGTLNQLDVQIAAFNPVDDYRKNGLILEFFPRIGDMFVDEMDGYTKSKIEIVEDAFAGEEYFAAGDVQPNVIYIQNEALWDVYEMERTAFNVDPMKHMRKIGREKNGRFGKMATSVFGGGTCLPEFEAITGLNCRYLLSYGYPYVQYITNKTPSIVSTFKNNGYQTVAFHPYHKNFYSRNRAYPLLGFDEYYGMEDMDAPEKSGWYISDMAATDFIIETYEKKKEDGPLFMFTVTMQNHGGYTPARYENYDVKVDNPGLNAEDSASLLDFTQGVYEADLAFKALVDYFREVDAPTVIVMYGDHLPLLSIEGRAYREGGYVENVLPFDSTEHEQLHETPYVVWANYKVNLKGFDKKISAGKIGLELMRLSGLAEVPPYFNALYALYDALPVVNPYFIYDKQGNKLEEVPEALRATENAFKYIQYDLLHGKHYVQH